jgi:hypothetical protein
MSDILSTFQQQEAEATARMLQLNRWSLVMIEVMITEQEEKLLASDLPVEGEGFSAFGAGDTFWEELV